VSRIWNTLLPSLIQTAQKLELLGFTYNNGVVSITELEDIENVW